MCSYALFLFSCSGRAPGVLWTCGGLWHSHAVRVWQSHCRNLCWRALDTPGCGIRTLSECFRTVEHLSGCALDTPVCGIGTVDMHCMKMHQYGIAKGVRFQALHEKCIYTHKEPPHFTHDQNELQKSPKGSPNSPISSPVIFLTFYKWSQTLGVTSIALL